MVGLQHDFVGTQNYEDSVAPTLWNARNTHRIECATMCSRFYDRRICTAIRSQCGQWKCAAIKAAPFTLAMLKVYAKELEIKRPYEIKAKKTVYEVDIVLWFRSTIFTISIVSIEIETAKKMTYKSKKQKSACKYEMHTIIKNQFNKIHIKKNCINSIYTFSVYPTEIPKYQIVLTKWKKLRPSMFTHRISIDIVQISIDHTIFHNLDLIRVTFK